MSAVVQAWCHHTHTFCMIDCYLSFRDNDHLCKNVSRINCCLVGSQYRLDRLSGSFVWVEIFFRTGSGGRRRAATVAE